MMLISIASGALGRVTEGFVQGLEDLEIRLQVETVLEGVNQSVLDSAMSK